jgi:putative hydrolase of the HAD superfamily
MQGIDWIIFDLGGVVVTDASLTILAEMAAALDVAPRKLRWALAQHYADVTCGRMTLRDAYAAVATRLGRDNSPDDLVAQHCALYRQLCTTHDPEAVALIGELRRNHHVACLTNTEPEIGAISRETGLFGYFERVFISVEMGLMKPNEEIYLAVLAALPCAAERSVFIDDRPPNVAGARQAGMHACEFAGVRQVRAELRRAGCAVGLRRG